MRETPEREEEPGTEAPCAASCHAQRILQTLNAYRRSGTLTDVVLRAGGRDFPCHRAALSAASAHFRGLFAAGRPERAAAVVPVGPETPGTAAALAVVLDYVYGAGVRLRAEDEAAAVLALAERLGVAGLREACARFLEGRLRAANSLALRRVAVAFSLASLAERCGRVLRPAFVEGDAPRRLPGARARRGGGAAGRSRAARGARRGRVRGGHALGAPRRAGSPRAAASPPGARAPAAAGARLLPGEGGGGRAAAGVRRLPPSAARSPRLLHPGPGSGRAAGQAAEEVTSTAVTSGCLAPI
ncbi:mCG125237, isoform CRA_c [Mus musculus]|nr:mCG125237, isoform CRA_c [Mus musculus]